MATELNLYTDAYATMTVATYQPLIVRWVSLFGIAGLSSVLAHRYPKAKALKLQEPDGLAMKFSRSLRKRLPKPNLAAGNAAAFLKTLTPMDAAGFPAGEGSVEPADVQGFTSALKFQGVDYPRGITKLDPATIRNPLPNTPRSRVLKEQFAKVEDWIKNSAAKVFNVPLIARGRRSDLAQDFDFHDTRDKIFEKLASAASTWTAAGSAAAKPLGLQLTQALKLDQAAIPSLWGFTIEEFLSPIGIAHYYRQLYFNKEEGVGPLEQAFTIAPLENFEIVYESTRKQVHEEIMEQGLEVVSESAVEEKNMDEVSDKVSSMVQQDISAAMSANASGGIGVWEVGASASASYAVSSQQGREFASRRLKEVTRRASERITKSFSLKTRDLTEVTTSNLTRRTIRNESDEPVSYGLRRVLRRVMVKVQDLGPRFVWQVYVRNPGEGLALSKFVHFQQADEIAIPHIPPGVPPQPRGGVDTGSVETTVGLELNGQIPFVAVTVKVGPDRVVKSVRIDSMVDVESGGKDDEAPSPVNDMVLETSWDDTTGTFTARIAIVPGDSSAVQVNYSYVWEPSQTILDEWEALRAAEFAKLNAEAQARKFERDKALITERSRIKARPANDLRREERYEVMNRMVSHLFGRSEDPSEPTPLEIEYFHRFFDIDGIFIYMHPAWWRPRFNSGRRPPYEITAESEPAPLGSSLGWLMQLDGDQRRDEFLNSPWLRVCVPIRPGREREAVEWLAKRIEGETGYDPNKQPLKSLLADIEEQRTREAALGIDGPEYVKVDSTPGAPDDPAQPEAVYPIVDEFEVTIPTDGFVYDSLEVDL